MRWLGAAAAAWLWALAAATGAQAPGLRADAAKQAAYFVRGLDDPRERREARPEILDAPVHPGSIVKTRSYSCSDVAARPLRRNALASPRRAST